LDEGYGATGNRIGRMWISRNLTATESESGNASLAEEILQAKQDKHFEAFFEAHPQYLGEDGALPTNWGQFKKSLLTLIEPDSSIGYNTFEVEPCDKLQF
jgi:hypothetical protein